MLASGIVVLHLAVVRTPFEDEFIATVAGNFMALLTPILSAAACWWSAAKSSAHIRVSWNLLGAAAASWAIGQGIWSFYEIVLRQEVPFPSLADAGYLGFIPLAAAGILVYSAPSLQHGDRARFILDGILIVGALVLMAWVGALDDTIQSIATSDEPVPLWELIVLGASPIGDLLIVSLVFLLLVRVEPKIKASFLLIAAGIGFFAVADTIYFVMINQGTYYTGHSIDLGWGIGFLLIAIAALRSGQVGGAPEPLVGPAERVVAYLPYLPLGLCLLLVADHAFERGGLDPELLMALLALVVLVLVRQLYSLFENQRLNRQLETTTHRLQELQELRKQFLNNVVHDLRTPLTPLKIHLHLLEHAQPPVGPDQSRSIHILKNSARQFEHLVNDLQDVFKIESGQLRLMTATTDIGQLALQVADASRDVANEKGIRFDATATSTLLANADPARVTQVLHNLLSNALKFTPREGKVSVTATRNDGHIRVAVNDNGRGLTPDEQARLFKPFSQVHDRREVNERGTGLGLYISRGIIEQHDGRMWVESQGRGFGSTFLFELPALDAAESKPAA